MHLKVDGPITANPQASAADIRNAETVVPGASGSSAKAPPDGYEVLVLEVVDMAKLAAQEDAMTDEELMASQESGQDDEVFVRTIQAKSSGVYRVCANNDVSGWSAKVVELDIRTNRQGGEVVGLDSTGHVPVYVPTSNVEDPDAIKDEHVDGLLERLKSLEMQFSSVEKRQSNERHRLNVHIETNEASHSRMVIGSLLETVIFIAVSAFQIIILKKWFDGKGSGMLGGSMGGVSMQPMQGYGGGNKYH